MSANYDTYITVATTHPPNDTTTSMFSILGLNNFSNCHRNAIAPRCRVTTLPPCRGSRYHASRFQTPSLMSQGIKTIKIAPRVRTSGQQPWDIYFCPRPKKSIILHGCIQMLPCQQTLIFRTLPLFSTLPMKPKYKYSPYQKSIVLRSCHKNAVSPCCWVTTIPPCRGSGYHTSRFQTPRLMSQGAKISKLLRTQNPQVHSPGLFTFAPGQQNR